MKVLLIQLSDIHFTEKGNSILLKRDKLLEAIQNETKIVDEIFLLVTGDSAFSGKIEEFDIASTFLTEIKDYLFKYSGKSVNMLVIPGNHDCQDLTKANIARESLIRMIQASENDAIDDSIMKILGEVQSNYEIFSDEINDSSAITFSNQLLNTYKFAFQDATIIFHCYNTAFQSILHENAGKMIFPLTFVKDANFKEKADVIISCFHHPLHWLSPNNRREFKSHVEYNSDFYLTGHEHESSKSFYSDLKDNVVYYIEGDVLQDNEDPTLSGFNLLHLDLDEKKLQVRSFTWNGDIYKDEDPDDLWLPFNRGALKVKSPFELKNEYKKYLDDVGVNLTHPNISSLRLEDVFVYPRLERINYFEKKEDEVKTSFDDSELIINALNGNIRLSLTGAENIGKTTLLKVIYTNLYLRGYVPVFVEGYKIKQSNLEEFRKLITQEFLRQYEGQEKDGFLQLNTNKIIIIIDDIDKCALNPKFKGRLISNLISYYENLILSGNELMSLEDILTDETTDENLYTTFNNYRVREFGNVLREKLIHKWVSLGENEETSEAERIAKIHKAEIVLRTVIGKNLVPSYPLFLLTILQAIEIGNPADLSASTFGHYYQFLIQKSFSKTLKSQDEFTSYNNYLGELANHFFVNKIRSIGRGELIKFDKSYRERFTISHSLETILENLKKSDILFQYDDLFEFKYAYFYYYFTSRYFSENIDKQEVRDIISALCKRVHQTQFANILLFLTHHSRDKYLLTEILESARSIFVEEDVCKIQNDIESINSLGSRLPTLVYEQKNITEKRKEINEEKDSAEDSHRTKNPDREDIPNLEEDVSDLDVLAQVNLSFKTIEIMGQILKNNYGKIENKMIIELIQETYLIGLRTLNTFFKVIEDNTDFIVNRITESLDEKGIKDREKVIEISKKILFSLCVQMSYVFIKKVSDSVGTENLVSSYEVVLINQNYNSARIIDFSIKLEHFRSFPNDEMSHLKDEFVKYPLALQIIRKLVINYLDLFPTTYSQKQKISSVLDIPMPFQRRIDNTSSKRAR